MTSRAHEIGYSGEERVYEWLSGHGLNCVRKGSRSPFDLLVNEHRVEIKTSRYSNRRLGWMFNIHRHGKIDESQVDVYVLRLEEHPENLDPIHLVLAAPLKVANFEVSKFDLTHRYVSAIGRLSIFSRPCNRRPCGVKLEFSQSSVRPCGVLTDTEADIFQALKELSRTSQETFTQAEIAEFSGYSTSTINRSIKALVQKRFICGEVEQSNRSRDSYQLVMSRLVRKVRHA